MVLSFLYYFNNGYELTLKLIWVDGEKREFGCGKPLVSYIALMLLPPYFLMHLFQTYKVDIIAFFNWINACWESKF